MPRVGKYPVEPEVVVCEGRGQRFYGTGVTPAAMVAAINLNQKTNGG